MEFEFDGVAVCREEFQDTVESAQLIEVSPVSNITDNLAPLVLRVDKSDLVVDVTNTFLYVKAQLLHKDGSKLTYEDAEPTSRQKWWAKNKYGDKLDEMVKKAQEDENAVNPLPKRHLDIAPVDLFGYAMWESVSLFITDQKVSLNHAMYPWLAYVLHMTNYSQEAKKCQLRSALWYPDQANFKDFHGDARLQPTADYVNHGFAARRTIVSGSTPFEMFTRVVTDLHFPGRLTLPPNTECAFEFRRAPLRLCLHGEEHEYTLQFLECKLYVNRLKLTEQALVKQHKLLSVGEIEFRGIRFDIRRVTAPKGEQIVDWNAFSGALPRRIYVFMTRSTAEQGKMERTPFNFEPFGMSSYQIFVNETAFPVNSGVSTKDVLREYMMTQYGLNFNNAFDIEPDDFAGGNFVLVTDLTADHSAGCVSYKSPLGSEGTVRVLLHFAKPLEEAVTVFCLAEIEGVLSVDKNRNPMWNQTDV